MQRARIAILAMVVLALVAVDTARPAVASPPGGSGPAFVPGEILLKFKSAARPADRAAMLGQLHATGREKFRTGAERWLLGSGISVEEAIQRLSSSSLVQYAEPNYILTLDAIPTDPRYTELWGLNNTGQTGGTQGADIDAQRAWNVSTGSHDVMVAVIDTGVDYNHPDLAANIWTNPGEIAGNGIDDDNNGFIDDIHGWDFYNNDITTPSTTTDTAATSPGRSEQWPTTALASPASTGTSPSSE